jgi:predicted DNA-binding transcriptional regulator YafY
LDRFERISALHRVLSVARYPVPFAKLRDVAECSRATVYRDLHYLRDVFGAPVEFDSEAHTVRYVDDEHGRFELPGLWLSSDELYALIAAQQLVSEAQGGYLTEAIAPLKQRIERLAAAKGSVGPAALERIRIIRKQGRRLLEREFRIVAHAVLKRVRLKMVYHARIKQDMTQREVSPQRLTYYRDNWYLDAYCHLSEGLRTFALERIKAPMPLETAAVDVGEVELNQELAAGYGIFSGPPRGRAVLKFSKDAARWVAEELWHRDQQTRWLSDGRFELTVPYSDPTEILMDALRFGPDVEIAEPPELRALAAERLRAALRRYA